jgi:uncharacterized membrane protein
MARAMLQQSLVAAVSLAISTSFVALAIALESDARWIALGWAAEAGALWLFAMRLNASTLRGLATVFAVLAGWKILADTPSSGLELFTPIFNGYALPSLSAIACIAAALIANRHWLKNLASGERNGVGAAAIICTLLIDWVVSVDLYSYFMLLSPGEYYASPMQYRLAQMSLSAWWAVYATIVLAIGFRAKLALFRWTALVLYAVTIAKVFLLDMAGLDELYRIVAFFVLAIVLGLAAWAYQRTQTE